MSSAVDKVKRKIDGKMVLSSLVALGIFGAVTYFAIRSGVKPVAAAAKVVKG